MYKIGNIAIIVNFVFPYIFCFLFYLQHMMLVNVKLDISGYNNITFKGYRLHWTSSFLMAHLKQNVAILALLYCGEFVKNSIDMIEVRD